MLPTVGCDGPRLVACGERVQWCSLVSASNSASVMSGRAPHSVFAPCLAESGAHSMDRLFTTDGLMKEPSARVQHTTKDFCIAPRLAESGAHSMDGVFSTDGLMKEPSAQVQHATNDFCIAPRLAESGAHSMDGAFTTDGLMKEPSAQVQHATNDFCIAPRLAESSAHSMNSLTKEPSAQGLNWFQNGLKTWV